jgi:hypothetical protein
LGLGLVLVCAGACGSDAATDAVGVMAAAQEASKAGSEAKTASSGKAESKSDTSGSESRSSSDGAEPKAGGSAKGEGETKADAVEGTGTGTATATATAMPAKNECGLKTDYLGDDYCIKAPDPEKGWQLHIGPEDYAKVDPKYILQPGEERTDNFDAVSSNDKKVFFY